MYLLYHRKTRPTGQQLGQLLNIPCGLDAYGMCNDVLVRWGSQAGVGCTPDRTLNLRAAMERVSDKLRFLTEAKEAYLPVPDAAAVEGEVAYPCLARVNGESGGRGITFLATQARHTQEADFYVEYVPLDREFRVHVFNGAVIGVQEKVLTEGVVPPTGFQPRNSVNGYVFKRKATRYYPVPSALGVAAVGIAGLTFGAVDMVTEIQTGMAYVLEVNSAPSLEGSTLTSYAMAISNYLDWEPGETLTRCEDYMATYGSDPEED